MRGSPRVKTDKKVSQALCLDSDVLEAYRRSGMGWQTRHRLTEVALG